MIQDGFAELLDEFLLEAHERTGEVESLLLQLDSSDVEARRVVLAKARRELHTLKGNAGMMGFADLQQLTHLMEDQVESLDLEEPRIGDLLAGIDSLRQGLEEIGGGPITDDVVAAPGVPGADAETVGRRSGGRPPGGPRPEAPWPGLPAEGELRSPEAGTSSVRVPFSRIDQLVEMQAESLIYRNRLSDAVERGKALVKRAAKDPQSLAAAWEEIEAAQQALEKTLKALQQRVTELSMVPLRGLFRSLRRIVHDESRREGKDVELEVSGGETPIDKTLLEAAADALGHLVRNAVIHGVEEPAERRRKGKRETGRVRLSATIDANQVRIEVADDGAGIDLDALRAQGAEVLASGVRGRAPEADAAYALVFEDGVSTRGGADVSAGRGIGLSAVKKSVERHGGRVALRSRRDVGTAFTLRLPISASILRSLTLRADGEEYALPLTAVAETLRPAPGDRHEIHHAGVIRWRGRVVPLLDLGCAFGTAEAPRAGGFVLVMEIDGRYRALAFHEIVGIRDIVVKGLDRIVGEPPGVSGSTILGDGRVIMILDPTALATIPPFTASER